MSDTIKSIANAISELAPEPVVVVGEDMYSPRIALPPNWKLEHVDLEKYLDAPRRKIAAAVAHDTESFISYTKRHGSLTNCTVWCNQSATESKLNFKAIINDHGDDPDQSAWRDHTITYEPRKSVEWTRWFAADGTKMSQSDFATFLEDNNKDIANIDGYPTGAQMLEMALRFEATQDAQIKSAIRLQDGSVSLVFVDQADDATQKQMALFERFAIGVPVFWKGDAYQVNARLRYRIANGRVTFWYELVRPDQIFDAAGAAIVKTITEKTGFPSFFGTP